MPTAVEVVCCLAAELLHGVCGVGPLQHQTAAVQMGAVTQRIECPLKSQQTGGGEIHKSHQTGGSEKSQQTGGGEIHKSHQTGGSEKSQQIGVGTVTRHNK